MCELELSLGGETLYEGKVSKVAMKCLGCLVEDVKRVSMHVVWYTGEF